MNLNAKAFGLVIIVLGVTLVLSLLGIIALAATDHSQPDILQITVSSCVAGLIGLLVKTPEQPPPGNG